MPIKGKSGVHSAKGVSSKPSGDSNSVRRANRDLSDTFGVRGAGATWQASFGMALNERDLLFAVRREPVAWRLVFGVAHDIWDKGFTVEEVAEKPDLNWSREVSKVLDDLNAKANFTQMSIFERLFGWSIVAITYVDRGTNVSAPVTSPKEIRQLLPYCTLQFTVQGSDEDKKPDSDRFGLPEFYTLRREGVAQARLHYTRAIHCATRLLDHPYKGVSVLEPLYDDLTVLRNIRWGLGQTIFRYGRGFPDVTVTGAKQADLDALEDSRQFANLTARTYFLHSDKSVLEFKGLAGRALDPTPYYEPILESIAIGSSFPKAQLRGAQAGGLEGSEVNQSDYFKYISGLQTLLEPNVWDLIDRLMETGQIRRVSDYRVVWPGGVELSEKDRASVELMQAQARTLKLQYSKVDEVRAEEDKAALPDKAGEVVIGLRTPEPPVVQAKPGQEEQQPGAGQNPQEPTQ
jgi:hypothetical protein